ncbi:TonB-linked SusC/RagA family outer membrane protein [Anseongella ginsenosidimutans]|uniref:TonB-linked SusC/RagA family outer membrane protein n=1 Tax=Anseongella ginsenosidimutans TaxID=496056 RepID=A0A4R3KWW3_9SPHI|nr:TonB-dependent receptor [Anseongella ginsenosidimutans]QEC51636.1 TonB-dependent receptor [Anseongella ginsenosidimutans]TCS88970.1 TonB-linked SusC/RagA family outer membrane protein [Anseongella ginsenosidimutans]
MKRMLWLFLLVAWMPCLAQQVQITGVVTDAADGTPLPGVGVVVKGGQNGTATDAEGRYSLSGVPSDAVLVFSFVGYKTLEESLNGRSSLDAALQQDMQALEEVVVVGYGTQKKINVTGAVDQISGEELVKRPLANVFQGLQGVSPGLNITYSGGQPGTTPNINVRGFTSINGGSPLIVIDGIASATDDLLRLNPSDIASISVLRDAASAAIYGARAAYGVVLVTTKAGNISGKQTVSYNNYFSLSRRTVMPEPVTDPYIFSRVLELSTNNTPWDYVNYSDEHYSWARARSDDPSIEEVRPDPEDPSRWAYMGNNNWNDYFFNESSFSQYHSLAFSGSAQAGKAPIGYYLSADYTYENGLNKLTPDDWTRYSLRARLNFSPLSWLKLDNNLNIYQPERDAPTYSVTDVYYLRPIDVAKNPDGSWANTGAGRLAAQLTDGGRNVSTRFGFQDVIRAEATFLEGELKITANASFKRELWKYHTDSKKYSIGFGPDDIREEGGSGWVRESNGNVNHDVYDLYANYNKNFGDHGLQLLAGYNQESYEWSLVRATRNGIISSSVPFIALTSGEATIEVPRGFGGDARYGIRSYFGRIHYTYKGRYILEGNGRYDGSSRFPASNRWGFFPSVSAAWIASEEPLLKDAGNTLTTLKFRASLGELGNQDVDYFGYLQTLPLNLSGYLIDGSRQTVITGAPSLNVDPDNYTWEKVVTMNVGADIGFFKDRLQASFDYYVRDTKGMLTQGVELPAVLGTSPPRQNSADLSTRGWELMLQYMDTYQLASKPFFLSAKMILSDSRSEITRFKNDQLLLGNYREGQEIGEIWGLTNNGLFRNEEEIAALDESSLIPWGALDIVPGWPKYKDLNGDGKIEAGISETDPKDLSIIGNTSPRYRIGFNLDMSWNNIDLSVFLQGIGKIDFYPQHYLYWGPYQQPYANVYPWNLDFYRSEGDSPQERSGHSQAYLDAGLADANLDPAFPVMQSWLADNNYRDGNGNKVGLDLPQSGYLQDASYLRVKNITLGYTLPQSLTNKWKMGRVRVFVSGENIFEFSAIKKYLDPESITDGFGWAYPYHRKYAIGLNVDL